MSPKGQSIKQTYHVMPVVVEGSFLLSSEFCFSDDRDSISLFTMPSIRICPHMSYDENHTPGSVNAMSLSILRAFDHINVMWIHGCSRCLTDYAIGFIGGKLICHVWQDLGNGGTSQLDPAWRINVWDTRNNEYRGPSVSHRFGTIQDKFKRGLRYRMLQTESGLTTSRTLLE